MSARGLQRVLSWCLLLGTSIAAFILAVLLTRGGTGTSFILASREGPLENWTLSLLSVAIAGCVYLLRGVQSGVWSLSVCGLASVAVAALVLFLLGAYGLLIIAGLSLTISPFLVRGKHRTVRGDSNAPIDLGDSS